MNDHAEYYSDDEEAIEAYCVRCKETIEIDNPKAVWTRRGVPATRGECPDCGGTLTVIAAILEVDQVNEPFNIERPPA